MRNHRWWVLLSVLVAGILLLPSGSTGLWAGGSAPAGGCKIQVTDRDLAHQLVAAGAAIVGDYGSFLVLDAPSQSLRDLKDRPGITVRDDYDVLTLHAGWIWTRQDRSEKSLAQFQGKRLHLVQFPGPVQPAWYDALVKTGAEVVCYIPANGYLVYGGHEALKRVQHLAKPSGPLQWEGTYSDVLKIQPGAYRFGGVIGEGWKGQDPPATNAFAIQLVRDEDANKDTLALVDQYKLAPVLSDYQILNYRNVIVRLAPENVAALASRPDVVSIDAYVLPKKLDERQDQIVAGNMTGNGPSAPGYLTQLATWGFTQAQFTTSGFAVNVSDSGIDNATTTPNHFGLHTGGDPAAASRVIYNRLEGTPNSGSTLQGCDGHGTLNSHIVAGYVPTAAPFNAAPHMDASGYHYGLGVCPFVKVGSSVIFDPGSYTSPNHANLCSEAYHDGARLSTNSWGAAVGGAYNTDSQAYDALVRDAQPTGSTYPVAGNQEFVIVFSAGNSGSSANTIGSPGTAKNVITSGASEGVQAFGGADQCAIDDTGADSANDIIYFSSRGPCDDGRIKPDFMAPGTHISGGVFQAALVNPVSGTGAAGACYDASGVCGGPAASPNFWPAAQQWYTASSGTSHSCPAMAGGSALVRQYFINQGWTAPSPAMTKAYLMNSARYMTGTGANDTLYSNNQGMGMMNLGMAFDGTARILHDELPVEMFTATGQTRTIAGTVASGAKPFRVTLAWTDAPGATSGNAYNNDLNLTVTVGGNTYLGNVFSGANSTTGGAADPRDNVESVFVPAGVSGAFVITITAANIVSDGVPNVGGALDQDFALAVYNGNEVAVPVIQAQSSALTAESCAPPNSAPDPGETVSYNITLQNVGTLATTNLVATLEATGGVTAPSGPQTYGAMAIGASATKAFTFTVDPAKTCGGTVVATLDLQDGASNLGTATFTFQVGTTVPGPTTVYSSGGISVAIPDNTTVTSTITVADTYVVSAMRVRVRINHTWDGDLTIKLIGPDATTVNLSVNNGSSGDNYGSGATDCTGTFTIFNDAAATAITAGTPPYAGSYKPQQVLSAFAGKSLTGTWTLSVNDNATGDTGTLYCWQMDVDTSQYVCCGSVGTPNVTANGANITAESCTPPNNAIDPGETVSVDFGLHNIGTGATTNLVATLQATGGVTSPSGPQTYGALAPGGPTVFKSFTFTANPALACGGTLTATLQLQDGATNLGTVDYVFNLGVLTPTVNPTVSNATSITIPDSGAGAPYPSTIAVSGLTGTVSTVTATLTNISHTFPDDINVLLVGPAGQSTVLMQNAGSSLDIVNVTLTFDDAAASTLPDGAQIVAGTYKPSQYGTVATYPAPAPAGPYGTALSAFNGSNPNGTWSLYVFDDAAGDSGSISGGWSLTITTSTWVCSTSCCPTILVSPATLPGGTVGTAYSQTITASGGTGPYNFTVTAGTPPTGVNLAAGGLLSGTPTAAGTFNFTVTATDANTCTGTLDYSIQMVCPTITVNPATLPGGTVGVAYNQTITASGGTSPYTYAITAGAQPTGTNLSAAGVLSGTPTVAGPFNFTVTATDLYGCTGTRAYSVVIAPAGGGGTAFIDDYGRAKICIDIATGNYTWTILTGPLAGHSYTGTATVTNNAVLLTLISPAGNPQHLIFYYYKNPKTATGTFVSGSVVSSLVDSNTTNDPPGLCGSGY